MKRRNFIQATLVGAAAAAAPVASQAGSRLYGAPGSLGVQAGPIGDKFMLPLARSGVPSDVWRPLSAASQLLEDVLISSETATAFAKAPKQTLQRYGLDSSDATLADEMVVLLTALSHPAVQDSLAKSDYEAAFSYLEAAGVHERRDPGVLEKRVEQLLADNLDKIKESVAGARNQPLSETHKAMMLEIVGDGSSYATEDDLAALTQVLGGDMVTPQSGVAVAVLAVAVAVAVGVGVVVHVHVAVSVSVVGQPPMPQAMPLFTGASGRFDPALMRNVERASRVGALTNSPGLQEHALKVLIAEEASAVLRAVRKLGIIDIPEQNLSAIIDAVTRYSYKVIGLRE